MTPKSRANAPIELENSEIYAIRNLARGEASPDQQKKAFQLIVERFCQSDDLSWRADEFGGARETDFAEGRRFPGLQLRKIAFLPADRVLKPEPEEKVNVRADTGTHSKPKPRAYTRRRRKPAEL